MQRNQKVMIVLERQRSVNAIRRQLYYGRKQVLLPRRLSHMCKLNRTSGLPMKPLINSCRLIKIWQVRKKRLRMWLLANRTEQYSFSLLDQFTRKKLLSKEGDTNFSLLSCRCFLSPCAHPKLELILELSSDFFISDHWRLCACPLFILDY